MKNLLSKNRLLAIMCCFIAIGLAYGVSYMYLVQRQATRPTPAMQATLFREVSKNAVDTLQIDITKCVPTPTVARFNAKTPINFINKDEVDHTISFTPQHVFVIPAQKNKIVDFSFFKSPGIRKYSCDGYVRGTVLIKK